MEDQKFDPEDKVSIYVPEDTARVPSDPIRLTVNGHTAVIPVAKDTEVARYFLSALDDAGIRYRSNETAGDGAGGGEDQGSGATLVASDDPQSNTRIPHSGASEQEDDDAGFDGDKTIEGNVDDVVGRLGALTDAQLAKVRAAEADREKPRKGVTDAIDAETERRKAAAT